MNIDASDLDRFAEELERSSDVVDKGIRPVIQKGALNIKQEWQQALAASSHFKGVAHTPSFDTEVSGDGVEAEIGPRTSGRVPGDLVSIAHFGGANGGGGVTDPQEFLANEAPKFEAALEAVVRRALS